YLLSGGPPFRGTSLYDILQAHHSMDARPLNLVRPEVPVELAAVVARMMAKDPDRRYQTPGEVAQALVPFFKKGGVGLKGPTAELSQARPPGAAPEPSGKVSKPTQPATNPERAHALVVGAAEGKPRPESMWESLIDFREPERPTEPLPVAAPMRWP